VVVPTPTLAPLVTYKAWVEEAETENGFIPEPLAPVMVTKVPVPVLLVLSLKVNKFELPVVAPQVKVVVVVAIESARFPVGLESADQAEPVPAPQAWSEVLHKIFTWPFSTTLNFCAVES